MAKYIDRAQFIDWLKTEIKFKDLSDGLGLCLVMMKEDFERAIKHMPDSIIKDVEPVKHARWMPQIILGERVWACSVCKTIGSSVWKRCPVCEAKMDLEVEEGL